MKKHYIIVSAYINDEERAFLRKLNRGGGVGGSSSDSTVWFWLTMVLAVAWFIVPSSLQPLGIVLFGCMVGCGLHYFRNYHRPLTDVAKKGMVLTCDVEIIALDREWVAHIDALTDETVKRAEDHNRFVTVRRLNSTSVSAERTEEILLLRRKLQGRDAA